jgi:hypothetical protein
LDRVKAAAALAKSDKHSSTAGLIWLQYVGPERTKSIFDLDGPRLFIRAESSTCMLQLPVEVKAKGAEDGWKVAIQAARLTEAINLAVKAKKPDCEVVVNKASVRIGRITIRTDDPTIFSSVGTGITKASELGSLPNPYMSVNRAQHCVGDEGVPCVAILPGQLLAAHLSQAITVDCDIFGPMTQGRTMVIAKDLLRVKHLETTLVVRLSNDYLVFRGETEPALLALRRQKWSRTMEEADVGKLSSVEEGNEVQFEFGCKVQSGKTYTLGLVMKMLLKAVEFSPEPHVVFKIPDLSSGPGNMIHLVDSGSHEVIALGTTGQLRESSA